MQEMSGSTNVIHALMPQENKPVSEDSFNLSLGPVISIIHVQKRSYGDPLLMRTRGRCTE